jgi:hypothetical protein
MTFYSWDEIDSVIDKFLGVKAKVLPFKLREGFEPDLKRFIQWRKQYQRALLEYNNQYVPPMVVTLVREEDYV